MPNNIMFVMNKTTPVNDLFNVIYLFEISDLVMKVNDMRTYILGIDTFLAYVRRQWYNIIM